MGRTFELGMAFAAVMLLVGCGDAAGPSTMPAGAGSPRMQAPSSGPKGSSSSSTNDTAGSATNTAGNTGGSSGSGNTGTAPAAPPPGGELHVRVANFTGMQMDACISIDGGKTWQGPIMNSIASSPVPAMSVSDRVNLKNGHITLRMTSTPSCTTAIGNDVKVDDFPGDWPETIVVATKNGAPMAKMLLDEPSTSDMVGFVRFVHTADWSMDADVGLDDGMGGFTSIFGDTPFLGIAKQGTLSKQGYAALDPMDQQSVILRTTTSQEVRATVALSTQAGTTYTLYTTGDDMQSSLVLCDETSPADQNHLISCATLQ